MMRERRWKDGGGCLAAGRNQGRAAAARLPPIREEERAGGSEAGAGESAERGRCCLSATRGTEAAALRLAATRERRQPRGCRP